MDVRQLEYVVAVAQEGSFTRAARRCHVAQSALSHQVARLEGELGTKLFERTSRSVRISEAGRALLPHAERVLRDMADARAAIDGLSGIVRGRLRIGMTQTASRTLDLIAVIGEVHRRYPDIGLATATGPGHELVEAVLSGTLDIALAALTREGPPPGITFSPLMHSEPLVLIVPRGHQLAARKRARLSELADSGFVEFRSGTTLRSLIDAAFTEAGIERISTFEVGQIADVVQYVGNGLGVAIVPRSFTRDVSTAESPTQVHILQLVEPALGLAIGAYRRVGQGGAIIDALLELVKRAGP